MNKMTKYDTVLGHVATWRIERDRDGFYCVRTADWGAGDEACAHRYGSLAKAHQAIRIAERAFLEHAKHFVPVANRHIWFDHGVLIVDDIDGGYYD